MLQVTLTRYKQYRCAFCGALFSYRVRAVGSARGPDARDLARRIALYKMLHSPAAYPCPQCGAVQPERVGRRREVALALVFVFAFFGSLVVAAVLGSAGVPLHVVWPTVAGLAAAFGLALVAVELYDPNRRRPQHLNRAAAAVGDELLFLDAPGTGGRRRLVSPWFRGAAFAALALAPPLLGCAEAVRAAAGWPANPDCLPEVAGPGDEVTVYFPRSLSSLDGRWSAHVRAEVLNAGELGVAPWLPAQSHTELPSHVLRDEEKPFRAWATVVLPPGDRLVGRTMRLHLHGEVTYPVRQIGGFVDQRELLDHATDVRLASPGSGPPYYWLQTLGGGAGVALFLLGGVLLFWRAERLKRTGYLPVLLEE